MDENKNKIYKLVGAKVLYYRTLEGLTQEELANKIHINVSTLSRIERENIIKEFHWRCYLILPKG